MERRESRGKGFATVLRHAEPKGLHHMPLRDIPAPKMPHWEHLPAALVLHVLACRSARRLDREFYPAPQPLPVGSPAPTDFQQHSDFHPRFPPRRPLFGAGILWAWHPSLRRCYPRRTVTMVTAREGDPFGRWFPFPSRLSAARPGMTTLDSSGVNRAGVTRPPAFGTKEALAAKKRFF